MPVMLWPLHGPPLGRPKAQHAPLGVPAFLYCRLTPNADAQTVPPSRALGMPRPIVFAAMGAKAFGKRFRRPLFATTVPTQFFISGVTKDSTGTILGSCTVKLFRTSDDRWFETVTSDATTGAYRFGGVGSANCYVVAYKAGSPDVAGTTVNTLVGQ